MPNDCIVISSVNNDYLRSDVIDNNSSNDINVDDGSIDNAVSNLDIASADINTFDDNASSVSDIYSIKDNDEISYIDSIDSDELDDIVNSTDCDVNTTESYRKNCHPFHYVRPSMTIKQIKMMYSEGGGLCWKSIP